MALQLVKEEETEILSYTIASHARYHRRKLELSLNRKQEGQKL